MTTLSKTDSVALLREYVPSLEENTGVAVADALHYLPEGLWLAGAYLREANLPASDYLRLFEKKQEELLRRTPLTSSASILVATSLSLDFLEEKDAEALSVLALLGFFAPEEIPLDLFFARADTLRAVLKEPQRFSEKLEHSKRLALVSLSALSVSFSHRLISSAARRKFNFEEQSHVAKFALVLVASRFQYFPKDKNSWPIAARVLPHVLATIGHAEEHKIEPATIASVLCLVGRYWLYQADLNKAKAAFLRVLPQIKSAKKIPSPFLNQLLDLGDRLQEQGDIVGVKEVYELAMNAMTEADSTDEDDLVVFAQKLGEIHQEAGDTEAARAHAERVVALFERRYGKDHYRVAQAKSHQARLMLEEGRLEEGLVLFESATVTLASSPDAPPRHVLEALLFMASLRAFQKNYAGVRDSYLKALSLWDQIPEQKPLPLFDVLVQLSVACEQLEDWKALKSCCERALAVHEASRQEDSPIVAALLNRLATSLELLDETESAKAKYQAALEILQRLKGENHPDTVILRKNLESLVDSKRTQ